MTAVAYLEKLNAEQRRAVEHGLADGSSASAGGPLLIIAGAGSGKTNTLAHRVAHLIVRGADPQRMLLMTFSRRAAAEMTRRVERIYVEALGAKGGGDVLAWAGTFHAIGARLLRETAAYKKREPGASVRSFQIGLAHGIRHKLHAMKTERDATNRASGTRELVPIKHNVIEEQLAKLGLSFHAKPQGRRRKVTLDDYEAGVDAGRQFEPHCSVEGT